TIHFPDGLPIVYSARSLNPASIRLRVKDRPGGVSALSTNSTRQGRSWTVSFPADAVADLLDGTTGEVAVTIDGNVNGCALTGSSTIFVQPPVEKAEPTQSETQEQEHEPSENGEPVE